MANEVSYVLTLKDLLTSKLNDADKAANRLEHSISGVQSLLGALGVAGGIAGIVAFGKSVVEAGTKVEDARVGLTTLLKDANEAGRVIDQTMKDATATPFAFEGLLSANKALISAGESADGARATVLNLANAIAATGGGDDELQRMVVNLQQIKNTGKATALDIKQFAYAGINVYKLLADATNQPIEKVKDMEVSYDMLTYALKKAHDEGGTYAGGLEKMSKNTSIQISNLGDAMFQLSVKIFDNLKPAIDGIISVLGDFINLISNNGKEIKALAVGVTVGAAAWGVYKLAVNGAAMATGLLEAAQWALNLAMEANPMFWVVTAIGAVAGAIYYAYEKVEWFRAGLNGLWEVTKTVGTMIGNAMLGLGKIIMGVLLPNPSQIKEGWNDLTTAFQDAGTKIGESWQKGYKNGLESFGGEKVTAKSGKQNVNVTNAETNVSVAPKGASAPKAVTVNISIGKLIEKFSINTTNLQESTSKVQEAVANVLLQAVNDASIVSNI